MDKVSKDIASQEKAVAKALKAQSELMEEKLRLIKEMMSKNYEF